MKEFNVLLETYYNFLHQYTKKNMDTGFLLDLLPFNIVVDESGQYRTFDLEWESKTSVTPEYTLFRALMWFGYTHSSHLSIHFAARELRNIHEFIQYGFDLLSLDLDNSLEQFIVMEESIQCSISASQKENGQPALFWYHCCQRSWPSPSNSDRPASQTGQDCR